MRWVDAVKQWNAEHNKGKYCVPRKGSPEHAQVVALMGKKIETPAAAESAPAKMPRRTIKLSKAGYVAAKEAPKLREIGEKITKSQAKKRILKILKANLTKMKAIEKTKEYYLEDTEVIAGGTKNPRTIPTIQMISEFITLGLEIRAGKTPEPKFYYVPDVLASNNIYDEPDYGDNIFDALKKVAPKFLKEGVKFGSGYLDDAKLAKKVFGKEAVSDALERFNDAVEESEEDGERLTEKEAIYHFNTITQERNGYTDDSPIDKKYYLSQDFVRELPALLRLVKRKPFDPSKDMESVD